MRKIFIKLNGMWGVWNVLKNSAKKKNIFWRFLISYVVILIITLSIGSITYSRTFQMVKEDAVEQGFSALDQSREMLDTRLMEVENMVVQLSMDHRVRNFYNVQRPFSGPDYEKIREMLTKLPSYRLTNRFIIDTLVLFGNNDVLISSSFASASVELLYNKHIRYSSLEFENWRERILAEYQHGIYWPAETVTINGEQHSIITYLQSVPLGSFANHSGAIMVLIDEQQIHKTMTSLNIQPPGWYYIADREGNIISYSGSYEYIETIDLEGEGMRGILEKTIAEENMTLVYTTSSHNGWTYVAAYPTKTFMGKVNYIRNIYIFTVFVVFVVGAFIATYLAYRNTMPLKKLIKNMNDKMGSENFLTGNEYDYLEGTLEKLIMNNEHLKIEMEKQGPLLKTASFERLFRNGFQSIQELETTLSYIGLHIKGQGFVVMLLRMNGYNGEISKEILKELEASRIVVNDVLMDILDDNAYLHNIDNDKIAVLLIAKSSDDREDQHNIREIAQNILDQLYDDLNIKVTLGIGSVYKDLIDMSFSYEEANKALEYKAIEKETRLIWYKEIPKTVTKYYYPLDIQMRLINLVKKGDKNEALAVLKTVYIKNFIQGTLSSDMIMQLIYEIRGTVLKIKDQLFSANAEVVNVIEAEIQYMTTYDCANEFHECVVNLYSYMCDVIKEQKRSYNELLKEKILDYIHKEYMREELCLYTVASQFDLTEKYFSQLFKEQTGENFSSYLEKIRMKHVVELLKDGTRPVKEIAEEVGYSNANTFYKAFKRTYGISPRDYRRQGKGL